MAPRVRLNGAAPARPFLGPAAWLGVCALLLAGTWLQPMLAVSPHRWDWQPMLATAEPWRAWTAALVHWSPGHRIANTLGLVLVAGLGWRARLPSTAAMAWSIAWPLTHVALLARSDLAHYGGLSGVLHAGVAVAAVALAVRGRRASPSSEEEPALSGGSRRPRGPGPRTVGLAVLAGLAVKLLLERPWGPPMQAAAGWSIPLAPFGHLTGVLAGLACAAVLVHQPQRAPAPALDTRRTSASSGPDR